MVNKTSDDKKRNHSEHYSALIRKGKEVPRIAFANRKELEDGFSRIGVDIGSVFFKSIDQRATIIWGENSMHERYDKEERHILAELGHLSIIYKALPENTAKPIAAAVMGNEIAGYFVERIDGRKLCEYNGVNTLKEFNAALSELKRVLETLHNNEIGHGDITTTNVILPRYKRVKLIDPWQAEHEDITAVIMSDKRKMYELLDHARLLSKAKMV
jgi:hypothetical protein